MERSDLEVMLNTWKNTEMPPIPNKNDASIILIEMAFIFMLAIDAIPFVISNNPVNKGAMNLGDICIRLNKGVKTLTTITKKLLAFKIEIITEKSTTNPPITRIVEILFVMLLLNTSPKSDTLMFLLEAEF